MYKNNPAQAVSQIPLISRGGTRNILADFIERFERRGLMIPANILRFWLADHYPPEDSDSAAPEQECV